MLENNEAACRNSKACTYTPAQGTIALAKCEEVILNCQEATIAQELGANLCDGDLYKMVASEETCSGKNGGIRPYTCAAAIGGCATDWKECVAYGGAHPCPADKPISCWGLTECLAKNATAGKRCSAENCKATLTECPCPATYERCDATLPAIGACVTDKRACPPSCPSDKPVACPDKTCSATPQGCASSIACPAGQITCFDGKNCRDGIGACPNPNLDKCSPSFTCPDGKTCVSSYSECPTTQLCPKPNVLCPDSSCRASSTECPTLTACYSPTPYQCSDGSCTNFQANCPTGVTCPAVQPVKCPDRSCQVSESIYVLRCILNRYGVWKLSHL